MTKSEIITAKLTSGKFWLSIIAGIVFGYCSIKKILPPEAIASIVTYVFTAYFSREKDTNGQKP